MHVYGLLLQVYDDGNQLYAKFKPKVFELSKAFPSNVQKIVCMNKCDNFSLVPQSLKIMTCAIEVSIQFKTKMVRCVFK